YDVDGIELDFFRHPVYFSNPAWGKDATQADRDKMTALIRRIRRMTERVGQTRGRPILVGVRVPDSVGYCRAMGLDIERWLADGLVDLMAVSGYFRLNPWETSVALGHKHGVPVYPCLSETRMAGEARKVRASVACYRGRATNAWQSGADGVYLFNSFNPRSLLWRELGDPATLETLDRVYCVGARGVKVANSWMANAEKRFLQRPSLSPERPIVLGAAKAASVELRVGDALSARKADAPAPKVTLQLRVSKLADPSALRVAVNGKAVRQSGGKGEWLDYAVAPAIVRQGANRIEVALAAGSRAAPMLQDMLLWVRFAR
ncbi:hypothetical protein HQ576_15995, partial [bacterium]|nr:hypothetical protein [bacterium]